MSIPKPNFFIAGGPKCGTTAMSGFLKTHPDIFISEPKEVNFFADDMPKIKFVNNLKDYHNLFKKATDKKIVTDASIFYLYSDTAIKKIYDYNPEAKFLVMLRNPMEMVPSFHSQILFTDEEDTPEFEKAYRLEDKRKKGKKIPKLNRVPKLLYYSEIAKYGKQLQILKQYFPESQIKVILFDDFKKSNRESYLEVLEFLELDDDGRVEFPRINDSKKAKSKFLNKIINRPPSFTQPIARFLRKILNKPRLGIRSSLSKLNRAKTVNQSLNEDMKLKLNKEYRNDIIKLQKIINRDLSIWIS